MYAELHVCSVYMRADRQGEAFMTEETDRVFSAIKTLPVSNF